MSTQEKIDIILGELSGVVLRDNPDYVMPIEAFLKASEQIKDIINIATRDDKPYGLVIKGEEYEIASYSERYPDGSRQATIRLIVMPPEELSEVDDKLVAAHSEAIAAANDSELQDAYNIGETSVHIYITGIQYFRDKLKKVLQLVANGDEVILIRGSKPIAKIIKYEQEVL